MDASEAWSPYSSFLIYIFSCPHSGQCRCSSSLGPACNSGSAAAATAPPPSSLSKSGAVLAGTSAAVTHRKCFAFLDVLQGFGSPLWLEALGELKAN